MRTAKGRNNRSTGAELCSGRLLLARGAFSRARIPWSIFPSSIPLRLKRSLTFKWFNPVLIEIYCKLGNRLILIQKASPISAIPRARGNVLILQKPHSSSSLWPRQRDHSSSYSSFSCPDYTKSSLSCFHISSRNQLSYIPPSICQLQGLQGLILNNNRLVSLPEEIGRMASLSELDASCNEITHLPVQIGDLAALKSLNLRRNHLQEVPVGE